MHKAQVTAEATLAQRQSCKSIQPIEPLSNSEPGITGLQFVCTFAGEDRGVVCCPGTLGQLQQGRGRDIDHRTFGRSHHARKCFQ